MRFASQNGEAGVATWLQEAHADLGPFLTTVLLLMAELVRGAQSLMRPWLSQLPGLHDCLLAWTNAERSALQGKRLLLCCFFII